MQYALNYFMSFITPTFHFSAFYSPSPKTSMLLKTFRKSWRRLSYDRCACVPTQCIAFARRQAASVNVLRNRSVFASRQENMFWWIVPVLWWLYPGVVAGDTTAIAAVPSSQSEFWHDIFHNQIKMIKT